MDPVEKKPAASPSDRFQKFAPNTERQTSTSHPNDRQDKVDRGPRPSERPTYALELRAEPGVDAVRALRAVLKNMLRRYGLRCISAYEEKSGGGE
jgi:hypothetical protein